MADADRKELQLPPSKNTLDRFDPARQRGDRTVILVNCIMSSLHPSTAFANSSNDNKFRLHDALGQEGGADRSTVRCILASDPNAVKRIDLCGFLPLHVAAMNVETPVNVVRFIMNKFRGALSIETTLGYLPLHLAVLHGASVAVVRVLADRYPTAHMTKGDKGWLPLHLAVMSDRRGDVARLLVDRCPQALREPQDLGCMPLHLAAQEASAEVVELLVDLYPQALEAKEYEGWTPLHLACQNAPADVVQILVDRSGPDAPLERIDLLGQIPLHIAAKRPKLEVIQLLVHACPISLEVKDAEGCLPLHVALRHDPPPEVVKFLVDACPVALAVRDNYGELPLHAALAAENSNLQVVQCLVEGGGSDSAETLVQRTVDGFLPYEVAASSGAPLEVIYYLLKACPVALKERGPFTTTNRVTADAHPSFSPLLPADWRDADEWSGQKRARREY